MLELNDIRSELRHSIEDLDDAYDLSISIHELLQNDDINEVIAQSRVYDNYKFFTHSVSTDSSFRPGQRLIISRPINSDLFIDDLEEFSNSYNEFISIIEDPPTSHLDEASFVIHSTVYTISICLGVGMDFLMDQQSARKNFGERFGDVIISVFDRMGITHSTEIKPFDKNQLDVIISPHDSVMSGETNVDPDEVVVSIKTTTKDRLKNIYSDKASIEASEGHDVKWIGLFLNDVQREKRDTTDYGVQKTFVTGRFEDMQAESELDGLYYIDPPPGYSQTKFGDVLGTLGRFLLEDINELL